MVEVVDPEKIRIRRLTLRVSQEALGKAIGQDQAYVSRLERGQIIDITATTLARIARKLQVRMEDLMRCDKEQVDD